MVTEQKLLIEFDVQFVNYNTHIYESWFLIILQIQNIVCVGNVNVHYCDRIVFMDLYWTQNIKKTYFSAEVKKTKNNPI